jgi:hypothetical protein
MFLDGDEAHGYLELSRVPVLAEMAEVAVTSCVGSTTGYARATDGRAMPVLASNPISPAEIERKSRIRDGIYAFQALWLDYLRRKGDGIGKAALAEIDAQSAAILLRLVEYPTKPEADRLGGIHHDESFYGYSRQLCDWLARDHLEQHGAFMLLANTTCFWPQGVMARHSPRSVLALPHAWRPPAALGRIAVQRSFDGQTLSVTEEELAMLIELLRGWDPQQVIFGAAGDHGVRAIAALLGTLAMAHTDRMHLAKAAGNRPAPRVILVGPGNPHQGLPENPAEVAWVAGDPARLETLRKVRSWMPDSGRIVMVLTDSLPLPAIQGMLNYLAPHLGAEGIVTANHGRFDLAHLESEQPLTQALGAWQKSRGTGLGYQFCSESLIWGQANYNWTILARTRPEQLGDSYWSFTLPSLVEYPPEQRLLLIS